MTLTAFLLILLLVALNGFFVAFEYAIIASRRSRLDMVTENQGRSYGIVRNWLENNPSRDRVITATQLGIILVSLALGAVGENTFDAWLEPHLSGLLLPAWADFLKLFLPFIPLLLSLILIGSIHMVAGEQVPRVAALRKPEQFTLFAAPIMDVYCRIFKGFTNLLDWATRLVLGLLGLPPNVSYTAINTLEEIKEIVSGAEVESVNELPEHEMISAVIDFGELLVRQVLIPRTEIVAVEANTTVIEAVKIAVQNAHTKLPVYENNLDQIIGIIHLHELVLAMQEGDSDGRVVRDLMREALFVPESISVNKLLHQFRLRKKHIAIVLDEFGGTSGVVTLDDLIEEIVGVIDDPFETAPPAIQNLPDGSFLIDGLTLIEDINQNFQLQLQDEDYDTIAGFVLGKLRHIAHKGDIVDDTANGIRLRVEEMDGMRIARLNLCFFTAPPQASTAEPPVKRTFYQSTS